MSSSETDSADVLDVDLLMEDLRRRVAEKKAQGLYGVDALMEASVEDDGEPFGLDDLERLRTLAVQQRRHRRRGLDQAARGRRALARSSACWCAGASQPMYGMSAQSTAFNGALLAYLSTLAREVSALRAPGAREPRGGRRRARAEAAGVGAELEAARERLARAEEGLARVSDAALPERLARLERSSGARGRPPPRPRRRHPRARRPATRCACAWRRPRTTRPPPSGSRPTARRSPGAAGAAPGSRQRAGARAPRRRRRGRRGGRRVGRGGRGRGTPGAARRPGRLSRRARAGFAGRGPGHRPRRALDGAGLLSPGRRHRTRPRAGGPGDGRGPPSGGALGARRSEFWRDAGRRRPLHPDAVRMALEAAGLGATPWTFTTRPPSSASTPAARGTWPPWSRGSTTCSSGRGATPCMPLADGPRVAFVVPRYGPAWSAAPRCSAACWPRTSPPTGPTSRC